MLLIAWFIALNVLDERNQYQMASSADDGAAPGLPKSAFGGDPLTAAATAAAAAADAALKLLLPLFWLVFWLWLALLWLPLLVALFLLALALFLLAFLFERVRLVPALAAGGCCWLPYAAADVDG